MLGDEKSENDFVTNDFFEISPNPAHGHVTINFKIRVQSMVALYIIDGAGSKVQNIIESKIYQPNDYKTSFNTDELVGGVYFFVLKLNANQEFKRVVVIK